MQTFPCGHRVVCRKCFVKTIQMVVTQRMLPLRCVICRAKVIRLKQTTTGGLSTGHVRLNSKHARGAYHSHSAAEVASEGEEEVDGCGSVMNSGGASASPLSRPSSLLLELSTAGLLPPMNSTSSGGAQSALSTPCTPIRSPASPLTEVFRAQRTLYELQYLRRTGVRPMLPQQQQSTLDLLSADQEQDQVFSRINRANRGEAVLLDDMGEVSDNSFFTRLLCTFLRWHFTF